MALTAAQLQAYLLWKNAGAPLGSLGDAFLGVDSSGTVDVTTALQGYIDISYVTGTEVVIGAGTWLVTGLKIYSGQTITFMPNATLKMNSPGPCLSTLLSPGSVPGISSCFCITINYADINQNGQSGCAILLETCKN